MEFRQMARIKFNALDLVERLPDSIIQKWWYKLFYEDIEEDLTTERDLLLRMLGCEHNRRNPDSK